MIHLRRSVVLTGAALVALLVTVLAPARAAPADHHRHRPHVRWSSTTYLPGTPLQASGTVPGGHRLVLVQVQIPGGWHTIGRTHSHTSGKFSVSVSLDWYGAHRVRVDAPGRHPFATSTKVHVQVPYVPRGNRKDYRQFTSHGEHFSFNPCRTLRYRVNLGAVGQQGLPYVQQAMQQASWATGIKARYTGATTDIPRVSKKRDFPRHTDLVIAWADETQVPYFATSHKAGYGGPISSRYARDGHGRRVFRTNRAGVTLDSQQYADFVPGFIGTRPTIGELLIHEIGHAFGLQHVRTALEEIMNGVQWTPYPDGYFRALYAAGDLNGLKQVGLGQGCLRDIR